MYTSECQGNHYGRRSAYPLDVDECIAGHLDSMSDGRLALSAQARTAECLAALQSLQSTGTRLAQGPGAGIASNIKLVSVCMEALPKILAGVLQFCCVCSAGANASGGTVIAAYSCEGSFDRNVSVCITACLSYCCPAVFLKLCHVLVAATSAYQAAVILNVLCR